MKLEDRLHDALTGIAESTPVREPGRFDLTDVMVESRDDDSTRPRRTYVAVAALAVAGIGGLVIASTRDPGPTPGGVAMPPAGAATTAAPPEVAQGPAGALSLPAGTGLKVLSADVGSFAGMHPSRWYATGLDRPETGAHLQLTSFENDGPAGVSSACVLNGSPTTDVTLADGTVGCLENRAAGDRFGRMAFDRAEHTIFVEGAVTDDELVAAANAVAPSGSRPGFEILPAGLPTGVMQTGAGWNVSDFAAVSFESADDPMVSTYWNGDVDRSIFSVVTTDDAAWLTNHRLGYETLTDVTVRGVDGFSRTIAGDPEYLGVVWHADGLTYLLGSRGFTEAELLALIEQMGPATQAEWDAMQAAAPTPDVAAEELSATTVEAP